LTDSRAPSSGRKARISNRKAAPAGTAASPITLGGSPGEFLSPDNKVGVNHGGGLEWKLLPHVAIRFDVSDHFSARPRMGSGPLSSLLAAQLIIWNFPLGFSSASASKI